MITDAWRSMRPGARAVVGVLAVLLGLNLLTSGVSVVTGGSGPGGPTSSSYGTADDGLAGYAALLARHGHTVQRIRVPLDKAKLDPSTTLVLADPDDLSNDETGALAAFLGAGGRVLAAGPSVVPALAALPGGGPEWGGQAAGTVRVLVPVPELTGVTTIETSGFGSWRRPGGTLPVAGGPDGALVVVAAAGQGRVVAIADASPLQNRLLARADNAAFGLASVGDGRPVAFAEAQHGYGRGIGVAAVPSRWRWALAGGFLATIVWMWSRGRRLGPADEIDRDELPARRAYVEAMAGALARTREPEVVVAPLQERARRRLAERHGLPADALEERLRQAATGRGLSPAEVDALFRPCRTDAEVIAAGRALVRLNQGVSR